MKCSKCGYLGFETGDRCRNCGYEFSLAPSLALPDLPMRQAADGDERFDDFTLTSAAVGPRAAVASPAFDDDLSSLLGEPRRPAIGRAPSSPPVMPPTPGVPAMLTATNESELPLFGPPIDDTLLIAKPPPPRPPLSVRRSTPEVPRLRPTVSRSASLALDLALDTPPAAPARFAYSEAKRSPAGPASGALGALDEDAGVWRRVMALLVDVAILLAVDVAVIYLTMQICGVTFAELGLLPRGPLLAFLSVQNVGYLVVFTAGGQTLGKMATGIKVVTSDPLEPLDAACAAKRTIAWLVLAVPGGLGLLSALFSHDHRGLHDRFAGTRVVRAGA